MFTASSVPTKTAEPSISIVPSSSPSFDPSAVPSSNPSGAPSDVPSSAPSQDPSSKPSTVPSSAPSLDPSSAPSLEPSKMPSNVPTETPSTSFAFFVAVAPTVTKEEIEEGKPKLILFASEHCLCYSYQLLLTNYLPVLSSCYNTCRCC